MGKISMVRGTAAVLPMILETQDGERISLKQMEHVEVYFRQHADDIYIMYGKDKDEESEHIELGDGDDFTAIVTLDPDDAYALRHGPVEVQIGWIDAEGKPQASEPATLTAERLIKGGKIL